ncbi:hypothetical protein SAMN05444580_11552 [Rhodococcus tukisamuensis]|uniref:Uncharacterized protein n=1 Tax=Rhodococcus tukisamuensis TaxID=168276 RepID=A0A1G7C7N1_9NOCA|nr:hypothetical protein SAMN05444580_11552 [Rhodococcus tukisamuensis]
MNTESTPAEPARGTARWMAAAAAIRLSRRTLGTRTLGTIK